MYIHVIIMILTTKISFLPKYHVFYSLLFFFAVSAGIQRLWVQGTRSAVGTPYLADDGTPLPYTGPTGVLNNNEANSVRLSYESSNVQTGFVGYSTTDTLNAFICEI